MAFVILASIIISFIVSFRSLQKPKKNEIPTVKYIIPVYVEKEELEAFGNEVTSGKYKNLFLPIEAAANEEIVMIYPILKTEENLNLIKEINLPVEISAFKDVVSTLIDNDFDGKKIIDVQKPIAMFEIFGFKIDPNTEWQNILSVTLDFVPIVGQAKSIIEIVLGYNPITKREYSPLERGISCLLLFCPVQGLAKWAIRKVNAKNIEFVKSQIIRAANFVETNGVKLGHKVKEVAHSVKEKGIEIGGKVKEEIKETAHSVKEKGVEIGKKVKEEIKEAAHSVKEKGVEIAHSVKEKGVELGGKVKEVAHDVKEKGVEIGGKVKTEIKEAAQSAKEKGSELLDKAKEVKNNIKEKAPEVWDKTKTGIKEFPKNVKEKAPEIWDKTKTGIKELPKNVKEKAPEIWDKTKTGIKELPKNVKEKGHEIVEKGTELKNKAKEKAKEIKNDIVEKGNEIKNKATEKGKKIKNNIVEKGTELKNKAKEKAKEVKNNIVEKGTELKNKAKEKGKKIKNKAKEKGIKVKNYIVEKGTPIAKAAAEKSKIILGLIAKGGRYTYNKITGTVYPFFKSQFLKVSNIPSYIFKTIKFFLRDVRIAEPESIQNMICGTRDLALNMTIADLNETECFDYIGEFTEIWQLRSLTNESIFYSALPRYLNFEKDQKGEQTWSKIYVFDGYKEPGKLFLYINIENYFIKVIREEKAKDGEDPYFVIDTVRYTEEYFDRYIQVSRGEKRYSFQE